MQKKVLLIYPCPFLKKNPRIQNHQFSKKEVKISWIGPWVTRIDWCQGHWCGLTYMIERLSNVSLKTGKNCFFCVCFRLFLPLRRTASSHDHIGWATSMPFASINSTNTRTNPWNFHKNNLRIGDFEKPSFLCRPFWNFFFQKKKKKLLHPQKISQSCYLGFKYGWKI